MRKNATKFPFPLVILTSGGAAILLLAAWLDPALVASKHERNQAAVFIAVLLATSFFGIRAWRKQNLEEQRAGFDVIPAAEIESWRPSSPALVAVDLLENHIVIVHFWAEWNAHDREVHAALTSIASRRKVCLRACNVDDVENRQFTKGVANIPFVKIYVRGEVVAANVGQQVLKEMDALLDTAQNTDKA